MTSIYRIATILVFFLILLAACSDKKSQEAKTDSTEVSTAENDSEANAEEPYIVPAEYREWDTVAYEVLRKSLPPFDLNQDLSSRTSEELRFLRNTLAARQGFLFMNSDLRDYFSRTAWYTKLMEARWYGDCEYSGLQPAPPIAYTADENAFIERVKQQEEIKKKENYITRNGLTYANTKNIVNAWQFGKLPDPLLKALDKNGFAISTNKYVQLFHAYEKNDYSQTQNFVSTDLYLQLFHMHFSFMLRGLEEERFVPTLGELASGMVNESKRLATSNPEAKADLEFTQAFYSIPWQIMGGKNAVVPTAYQQIVKAELTKIENAVASPSSFIPEYKEVYFPYDMFKPRGHYTRTDSLKRYFKSMQWLQLGVYCQESDTDLTRALTAAFILNTGSSANQNKLKNLYAAILEPTTFLIGKPDNLSLLDLCDIITQRKITSLEQVRKPETVKAIRAQLVELEKTKNVIKPKIEITCRGKINFMPARFNMDNEILQEMTEPEKRPYPKGLDVMAAFGSQAAEDILINEHAENKQWNQFLPQMEKMKAKYKNYEQWDETVYTKWLNNLNDLLVPDKRYPSFMQLPAWNKKNLNTALASWAELKHDAVLYTEHPSAAECGGGGDCAPPPIPYVVGYVEPNVNYWKSALELIDLTSKLLNKHHLMGEKLQHDHERVRELCVFLLNVSEKELRGEKLKQQEYEMIEIIGSNVEYLTLSILGVYDWSHISGPDKEIAIVADVYTNNQGEKAGVMHAAVGYGNDLYVIVEIDGYLYLTKGSTFSYYEFHQPDRMTDEEWQEKLKAGKVYPVPSWMNEVIINAPSPQSLVDGTIYSSGC